MTTDTTNTTGEDSIDAVTISCMQGHEEARDRLRGLGWSEGEVVELERCAAGYVDFARCVAGEVKRVDTESE